jgi:hypothetical protein
MLLEKWICNRELYVSSSGCSSRAYASAADLARRRAIQLRGGEHETARPPVRPSKYGHHPAVRGVDGDAAQAADLTAAAPDSCRAAQENDIPHGRHRRDFHFGPQFDFSIVVHGGYRGERPRHGLRPQLAVRAEDEAPDAHLGGLQLETRKVSNPVTVLTHVGSKQ